MKALAACAALLGFGALFVAERLWPLRTGGLDASAWCTTQPLACSLPCPCC